MVLAETGGRQTFAVGHLALGYILGKASAKLLKTEINVPLVFALSIIPDIDLVIPFLEHRGPTHSIVTAFIVFIPIFAIYKRRAVPYLVALVQHSVIGDYVSGSGIQLLWPLTTGCYGKEMGVKSQTNIAIEWVIFLTSIIIMLKAKDTARLFQPHNSNLILTMPTFTVLLPTFLSFPLGVPTWLIPPHLVYLFIFSTSIIIVILKILKGI